MPRKKERIPYYSETVLDCSSGLRGARITDLSTGGCFIDSILEVSVGEKISFYLTLPDSEMIFLTAYVRYIIPMIGFGVEFTDLNEESTRRLEEVVSSKLVGQAVAG